MAWTIPRSLKPDNGSTRFQSGNPSMNPLEYGVALVVRMRLFDILSIALLCCSLAAMPFACAAEPIGVGVASGAAAPPVVPAEEKKLPPDPLPMMLDAITVQDWSANPASVVLLNAKPQALSFALPRNHTSELLSEFRCAAIIHKGYSRTQRNVDVYVYSFPDSRAAFAAYAALRSGSSNVVVRGDASSEDDATISFLKGTRFVTITTTAEDDELSKHASSEIADQLSTAIDEQAGPPSIINTLPILDRMRGTERIFYGPVAARKFMTIPYIGTLQLSSSHLGVYADYQFPHPEPDRLKLMLIDYGNDQTATSIYNEYESRLSESGHKMKPLSVNSQLVRMLDSWMLIGHSRGRVYVVSGAKHKLSPMVLNRYLY